MVIKLGVVCSDVGVDSDRSLPKTIVLHPNDQFEIAADVGSCAVRRVFRRGDMMRIRNLATRGHDLCSWPRGGVSANDDAVPNIVTIDRRDVVLLRGDRIAWDGREAKLEKVVFGVFDNTTRNRFYTKLN